MYKGYVTLTGKSQSGNTAGVVAWEVPAHKSCRNRAVGRAEHGLLRGVQGRSRRIQRAGEWLVCCAGNPVVLLDSPRAL